MFRDTSQQSVTLALTGTEPASTTAVHSKGIIEAVYTLGLSSQIFMNVSVIINSVSWLPKYNKEITKVQHNRGKLMIYLFVPTHAYSSYSLSDSHCCPELKQGAPGTDIFADSDKKLKNVSMVAGLQWRIYYHSLSEESLNGCGTSGENLLPFTV